MVGLSGGVDSSVAALRLLEQGWDVEGLFMKNWEEDDEPGFCSAAADLADAQAVAERLAERLGYECLSRDVLLEASDQFNIPEIQLVHAIEDAPSILDRLTRGKERYRPGDPVKVKMGAQASRKSMRLGPAQGVVFEITEPSRIYIDLTRPDDGKRPPK